MPFDVMTESPTARRYRLVEALRAELPENVHFDYMTVYGNRCDCGTVVCALGLASIIYPEHRKVLLGGFFAVEQQAALFGLTIDDAINIFWGQGICITPGMVADALERADA